MSTAIDILNFHNQAVRMIVQEDGETWWVAKDVCECLGIGKYRDAIARLDEDEGCPVIVDTPGGQQEMAAINEPGVYSLIFRSRKEEARVFKRWLAHEVIPSIRRTGRYVAPGVVDVVDSLQAQIDELRTQVGRHPELPLTTDRAPLVMAFWEVIDQLPRAAIDHSCNPNELGVNLPHLFEVAESAGLGGLPPQKLKHVLKLCSSFLRQTKVHSQIWQKPVHAWVFHLPEEWGV